MQRGLATPCEGIDVMRRGNLVVVTSIHELCVNIPGSHGNHEVYGRMFAVRYEHGRFELEVA